MNYIFKSKENRKISTFEGLPQPDLIFFPRSSICFLLGSAFGYWDACQNWGLDLRSVFALRGRKNVIFWKFEKLIFWWFLAFSGLLWALSRTFSRAAAQKQWLVEHFSSSARRVIRVHSRASFRSKFSWTIYSNWRKFEKYQHSKVYRHSIW